MRFSARSAFEDDDESVAPPRLDGVLDLVGSNPTKVGLSADAYDPDPFGTKAARLSVAAHYMRRGHVVAPENIVLSASTSEAYAWLFKLFTDAGDAVLVPTPSYPLFDCLAELEAVRLVRYPLARDENFRLDIGAIDRLLDAEPRVRAIIVVAPNNPTGTLVLEEDAQALEALAARRGLPLIIDEVFVDYLDPTVGVAPLRVSWASSQAGLTFVLSGLSKVLCAPGAKLAWTLVRGPRGLEEEALRRLAIIADTYLSVGSRVQRELGELLPEADAVQRVVRARLEENRATARESTRVTDGLVHLLPAHGGWSIILEVPRVMSDVAWSRALETAGVRVQAGSLYALRGERSLVVSLLAPPEVFHAGIALLCRVVTELSRE